MALHAQTLKADLRKQIKLRIAGISTETRKQASAAACRLLVGQPAWQSAASVLFYAPTGAELDIWPLLQHGSESGKVIALPRFEPRTQDYKIAIIKDLQRELHTGRYGIREPIPVCAPVELNRLDLILVPGVAFDLHGRRLGRGKGYYDQLLAALNGKTCGVAFDEQIVDDLPVEPHDSDVNCILTPTRWIEL